MNRGIALFLLFLCSLEASAATVQYAHGEVSYDWGPLGLRARAIGGAVLWYFDPSTRAFNTAGGRLAVARCTSAGIAGAGQPAVLRIDRDADGRIDAARGDSAHLYVGTTPTADHPAWFALDVSDPLAPSLLWTVVRRDLPGLADPVSPPAFTRLRLGQMEFTAILFASGKSSTSVAAKLFALDANTGTVRWSLPMPHAVAGGITPLDLDGDAHADRLYLGDETGAVWRIDLRNGASADAFARATRIAQLEGHLRGTPDVAFISTAAGGYLSIAIATGIPDDDVTPGWLYVLRDSLTDAAPDLITDADLPLVGTAVTDASRGWRLQFAPGEWLAEASVTIDGKLLFTTFRHSESNADCEPIGVNRVYALTVRNAGPALDLNGDGHIDPLDRLRMLRQREIVRGLSLVTARAFVANDAATPAQTTCTAGGETLPGCLPRTLIRRTFWYRTDAD